MKANLIKSLKNNAELVDIEPGRSARANFPGVNFDNAVLIINGSKAEPDTIIKEFDIVTLRLLPADLTDTPWWVSTFLIPFGFIIQPAQLAYKARKEAEEAQRELEKIKKLTNNPEIDNRPFLRGATNTIATGKSQPYFCGRNFITPYLFSKPYYKISGTDGKTQEVFDIFECGFKEIVFEKMGIGDTDVTPFGGSEPQTGVYRIANSTLGAGQLEIRQDGNPFQTLTQLNTKTVSNVLNREVPRDFKVAAGDAEYLVMILDPCAMDIEVCINFPFGLYKYNNDGERVAGETTITPEYSLNGGGTWYPFTFNQNGTPSNTFNRNVTKSLRYVAKQTFTLSDYVTLNNNNESNILVRVRNSAPDNDKLRADCFVYFYQSKVFDPLKSSQPAGIIESASAGLVACLNVEERERGVSCIAGLRMTASENNEDKYTQINFIATGTARTWNGTEWSSGKSPTRNPAAIALEILTSDTHPASRYTDAEIDLDAFGVFYEYCETNDLYFDDLITQGQKKDAELQKIADVCGVAFYKDIYGRRSVAIDQPQENAIAVYNPQNIISLTNKKTFARRVDALRIKYIDSTNDIYKENTYTVTRLENGQPVTIDENSIIKEVDAPGITRQSQIVKYARRLMAVDELRPVTTTLKIGFEGVYYTPYAKIEIQDPSLNRDMQDAVIESAVYVYGVLSKIILKNPVTFRNPLVSYGVIINTVNANGAVPVPLKVSGTGTTKELTVETTHTTSGPLVEANNVLSFGELDNDGEFTQITHAYVITRIARTDGGFNLDLQEYNDAIYETGIIPAYKPLVNSTPTLPAGTIPADAVTHEELDAAIIATDAGAVQAAVDTIQTGNRFTNIYRVHPTTETLEEVIARLDDEARNRTASISMSEEEILLQVGDIEKELVGLISIQAGAVTALVQGGGAVGEMSLSLNLPIMIDETKRTQLIGISSAEKVNAVYALVDGTNYYGIKGNASNVAVKALWDDAVAGGLIASQIDLSATQINIAAEHVVITDGTHSGETLVEGGKIQTDLIDVDTLKATQGFFEDITVTGSLWSKGIKSTGGLSYESQQEHYYPYIDAWYRFFDGIRNAYKLVRNPQDFSYTAANIFCHLRYRFKDGGAQIRGWTSDLRTNIYNDNPLKLEIYSENMVAWNEMSQQPVFITIRGILDDANRTDRTKTYWQIDINGTRWVPTDLEALQLVMELEF